MNFHFAVLAIICAPLSFAALQTHAEFPLEVEEGYVIGPDKFAPFGEGPKEFGLGGEITHGNSWLPLCFRDDAVHREVERHVGMAVRARGVWVTRGRQEWFLVEDVRLLKPDKSK